MTLPETNVPVHPAAEVDLPLKSDPTGGLGARDRYVLYPDVTASGLRGFFVLDSRFKSRYGDRKV